MEKFSDESVHNRQAKEHTTNDRNLASNHEISEMSTTTVTLRKISNILFEENNNENIDIFIDKAALETVEKSFYDIIGQNHSSFPTDLEQSSVPFSGITNQTQNESLPRLEFKRGMEEVIKFNPSIESNRSRVDLQANNMGVHSKRKNNCDLVSMMVKEGEEDINSLILRGKRHSNSSNLSLLERQKCKINVLPYKNGNMRLFDKVFLVHEKHYAKEALRLRVIMQNRTSSRSNIRIHESLVDLRTLLIHCSQAIATNDQNANQLIKQIQKHSSPYGDGAQRMAHIFVNGLKARLNGTKNELYRLMMPQAAITDFLSCFGMYTISCPALMVSQHFVNYTILNAARNASKLHIINLGADFGFTWLFLIHELSKRIGGPPKLRITNIESPASSYLPAGRLDLAMQKLESLSRSYGIPLEYRGLVTKWDKICTNDLNIEKDEVVIVTCYHGFEYLKEEIDVMNSPKNQVLDIIRRIKPNVFIQQVINGSFSSSFFVDRFKQVLLYTSALFDLFDATIPYNSEHRWFLENVFWAPAAINLIACEGPERYVGAETYKQWHTRNSRAGLEPLLLDRVILKRIKDMVREVYHKSFFIDDDKEWLLMGWKGRVMTAVSAWHSIY